MAANPEGVLLNNMPDYNGSQVQVDRIEVEEQRSIPNAFGMGNDDDKIKGFLEPYTVILIRKFFHELLVIMVLCLHQF